MSETTENTDMQELTDAEASEVLDSMEQAGEPAQEPQDDAQEPAEEPGQEEADQEPEPRSKPAREAAKYRTQLREVEAERDDLTGQVDTLRRQIVDSHIRGAGAEPSLLWDTGLDPSEVMDADGRVDDGKVRDLTRDALNRYGIHRPNPAQMAEPAGDKQPERLFQQHANK